MKRLPAAADSTHCAGSFARSNVKQETGRPASRKKPAKDFARPAVN
jgi:hypothetical protein